MKKKTIVFIALIVVLLAILLIPIPTGVMKDGGTREYSALTYKIIKWRRIYDDGLYEKTRVYLIPDNFKSIDALWADEAENLEYVLRATVLEVGEGYLSVEPVEGEVESYSYDKIICGTKDTDFKVGDVVNVFYNGRIMESYPPRLNAVSVRLSDDLRHLEYTGEWLDKTTAEKYKTPYSTDIIITKIYSNCFFARNVVPMPYKIKVNGKLPDEWCVGDQVVCECENVYYDHENHLMEADMLTVDVSTFQIDPNACYKPVIYLYPEDDTEVSVKIETDLGLTCTYPAYNDGWRVKASPDGTLTDQKGMIYNYLYWEGETTAEFDLTKGFCVKGTDTAAFLEDALARLGLNRREANEFIVYWLPLMERNPYNIISFQSEAYTDAAELTVDPLPDTVIRVFMAWRASEEPVELASQDLVSPERQGFTVVEWGGTELQ